MGNVKYRVDSVQDSAQAAIISALEKGPATRAELARATGYARTSLSTHIAELLDQGTICETIQHTPRGRPRGILAINQEAVHAIGVSLDRTGAWWVGLNPLGVVLKQGRVPQIPGSRRGPDSVKFVYEAALEGLGLQSCPRLGVALPHLVPRDTVHQEFKQALEEITNIADASSVLVDNSVRLAAYAHVTELGLKNALYIRVSAGVGCGVVGESVLVTGHRNLAGELGHSYIPGNKRKCICGRVGCLETISSLPAMAKQTGFDTVEDFLKNIDEGNPDVVHALECLVYHTITAASVLDPAIVIFDSMLFHEQPWTFDVVKREFDRAYTGVWSPVPVKRARRLDYAAAMGAALAMIRPRIA